MPESQNPRHRVLGMDVGARRIGLAVSDPLGITAQGIETLERRNRRTDFAILERVIRRYEVGEIVVGYPLRMSGSTGNQSEKMAAFAEELRRKFELPVHLWDERLTTAEAHRVLDQTAAVLILQSYLEARSHNRDQ